MVRQVRHSLAQRAQGVTTSALLGALFLLTVAVPPVSAAEQAPAQSRTTPAPTTSRGVKQPDINEISTQLLQARALLDAARGELAAEQTHLDGVRAAVRRTRRREASLQIRLDQAVVRLDNARGDVVVGRAGVAEQRSHLVDYARSSYQTGGTDMYSLGIALSSGTAEQAMDGLQDVDVVLNAQAVQLQQLEAAQTLLALTRQRVRTTRDGLTLQRQRSAANLLRFRRFEARCVMAKQTMTARVAVLQANREQLASAKAKELARLRSLATLQAGTTVYPNNGYLSFPVASSYVTSPYGMRMHPILHIWELHDGTDFQADCGTPVYSAAAGTITEEFFNAGYGNRVIMDNGHVDGIDLGTSYNHLTSFVAHVGQHVARSQLIAYSGTTGYSTGCHLHFMVYVNGATVDPMTWL